MEQYFSQQGPDGVVFEVVSIAEQRENDDIDHVSHVFELLVSVHLERVELERVVVA